MPKTEADIQAGNIISDAKKMGDGHTDTGTARQLLANDAVILSKDDPATRAQVLAEIKQYDTAVTTSDSKILPQITIIDGMLPGSKQIGVDFGSNGFSYSPVGPDEAIQSRKPAASHNPLNEAD
jgi:hypothetical protein